MRDNFQLAIPRQLAERIKRIFHRLGYQSVADFCQQATMDKLPREENRFEEIMEAIEHGRIKEGGDKGEL